MRSSHCFEETVEQLRRHTTAEPFNEKDTITWLQRGGCVIKTKIGYIQTGMPPETIKDTIVLGNEVPQYYIVLDKFFDTNSRLNSCEFEFPAYFNFFIKRKKATFICTKQGENAMRTVFQETLLGPKTLENFQDDFASSFEKKAIPNMRKEMDNFAGGLSIDTIIDFVVFDENKVELKDGVTVHKDEGVFIFKEDGKQIAIVPDRMEIKRSNSTTEQKASKDLDKDLFSVSDVKFEHVKKNYYVENFNPISFKPPSFGVTILGSSHGFDPHGSTSGMIFWVNGRGIALDPPPFSLEKLRLLGIPSSLIDYVIISHCHGDHDAGALQIILDHSKIEVITTRTIMDSFLRKQSAITDIPIPTMKKLFSFRPAIIGAPLFLSGAIFKFNYALHSIPTLSFSLSMQNKSIFFSGDTLYDLERLEDLVKKGIMTQERMDSLVNGRFDHTVVLHEAGVPPIHTPISALKSLPNEKKERIYLYHIADKDIPKDCGLKGAKSGVENTIILDIEDNQMLSIYKKLDLISKIDIFENLPLKSVRDMLESCKVEHIKAGEIFIKEGETGEKFYIVAEGTVRVFSEKLGVERFHETGDYLGEGALKKEVLRLASAQAMTDVILYSIERHNFCFIFSDDYDSYESVTKKFLDLHKKRQENKHINAISKNTVLNGFTGSQKIQLELILTEKKVKEGETLWKFGDDATFAFLIQKGEFELRHKDENDEIDEEELTAGAFVGDFPAMIKNQPSTCEVQAVTNGTVFQILKKDVLHMLEKNPKLLVLFSTLQFFE